MNFFKQKTAYEICACLVGSEMCIRDSNETVLNVKAIKPNRKGDKGFESSI
ncbi:hypothetical protein JMUB7533_11550 [Staphylococcus aureus]